MKIPGLAVSLISLIGLPVFSCIYLYRKRSQLLDDKFKQKFETLYLGLNIKK